MIENLKKLIKLISLFIISLSLSFSLSKAEVYKEKGIYLWDILAGAAIVEAAGGLAEIKNVRDNYQVDVTFSNQKIKG